MKKFLLGTSALLVAGFVAASANAAPVKLNVGGYANWYTGFVDGDNAYEKASGLRSSSFPVLGDVELAFSGETVLANGLKFGALVEVATTASSEEDQSYVYVDGAFGRVAMGKMDSLSKQFHTASKDVGLLGIQDSDISLFTNMGGVSTDIRETDDGQTIAYISPKMSGVTLGVSYTDHSADAETNLGNNNAMYLASVAYEGKMGGMDVGANVAYALYDTNFVHDLDYAVSAGVRVGMQGFTVGGGYKFVETNRGGDYSAFDFGVAYEQGPYGVSVSYIYGKDEYLIGITEKQSLILASASYNVTAGVDTFASFGYQSSDDGSKEKAYVFATGLGLSF